MEQRGHRLRQHQLRGDVRILRIGWSRRLLGRRIGRLTAFAIVTALTLPRRLGALAGVTCIPATTSHDGQLTITLAAYAVVTNGEICAAAGTLCRLMATGLVLERLDLWVQLL